MKTKFFYKKNIYKDNEGFTQRHFSSRKNNAGFTLLEILLVVAAIAILAGIIILAINPNKQLGDTRNSQRRLAIDSIVNAVYQYSLDHNGTLPGASGSYPIPQGTDASSAREICLTDPSNSNGSSILSCNNSGSGGSVDLSDLTTNATYLTSIPADPFPSASDSGMAIDGSGEALCFSPGNPPSANSSLMNSVPGPDSNDYEALPTPSNTGNRHGSAYYIYQDSNTHLIHVFAPCAEQTNWNSTNSSGSIDISTVR